jgi:hypothetical protein
VADLHADSRDSGEAVDVSAATEGANVAVKKMADEKKANGKRLSLHPLDVKTAVAALLATPPPTKTKKTKAGSGGKQNQ